MNSYLNKINFLVESRSVASIEYSNIIDEIVSFIENDFNSNEIKISNKKNINISTENNLTGKISAIKYISNLEIPNNLTKKIDIFESLFINVNISNYIIKNLNKEDKKFLIKRLSQGTGVTKFIKQNEVINNKLKYGFIEININAINSKLLKKSILTSLNHELNHAFEDYFRLISSENKYGMFHSASSHYQLKDNEIVDKYDKAFNTICYRLFDNSELSATVSQLYSELKTINSKRENFQNDLKNSTVFNTYNFLINNLNILIELKSKEHWDKYRNVFNYGTEQDIIKFKNYFCNKAMFFLKKLYKRMGSAASLYYDEIEKNDFFVYKK